MKALLSHQTSAYSSSNAPHPLTAQQGLARAKPALKNCNLVSFLPCSGVHTGWTMMLPTSLCVWSFIFCFTPPLPALQQSEPNRSKVSSANKNEGHFIRISSAAFQNHSLGLSSSLGVGFAAIFASTGFFHRSRRCRALLRSAATEWLAKLY